MRQAATREMTGRNLDFRAHFYLDRSDAFSR
jgi:hypothetical protein